MADMIWRNQVLALIQSVLVHLAVDRGLGRHRTKLSLEDYSYYSKVRSGQLDQRKGKGAPLMIASLWMIGGFHQSNTHALGPLPGQAHPPPRVLTVDALKANAADALGIYTTLVAVGLCGHHHLQHTVSAPPAMGPLRCWLL